MLWKNLKVTLNHQFKTKVKYEQIKDKYEELKATNERESQNKKFLNSNEPEYYPLLYTKQNTDRMLKFDWLSASPYACVRTGVWTG